MKFLHYLFHKKEQKDPETLAELLLHMSTKEKIEIFTKAAEKSNEDQRDTFRRAQAVH